MSCKCSELTAKMAALEAKIEEMVLANSVLVNRIANSIELKLDILANSEQISNQQKSAAASKKVLAKQAFFKDLLKGDLDKQADLIYSKEKYEEYMNMEDVKAKKTAPAKLTKVAEYLYKDLKNEKRFLEKFEELYKEYKNSMEEAPPAESED